MWSFFFSQRTIKRLSYIVPNRNWQQKPNLVQLLPLYVTKYVKMIHCRYERRRPYSNQKRLPIFSSPARMSLTNSPWQEYFNWYTHKTSGFKTSGFKTSGFKTSGFKTSGLQNVRFTKHQVSKRLVSKRPVSEYIKYMDVFFVRAYGSHKVCYWPDLTQHNIGEVTL